MSTPKLLDLRPDRSLLNPNFDGYKLCLKEISTIRESLEISVNRLLPNSIQYSLLYVKLFGLHNHLVGEQCSNTEYVYFIDQLWNVRQYEYSVISRQITSKTVWQIPCNEKQSESGAYNATIKLCNEEFAVVADGLGTLFILRRSSVWELLFSGEVIGPNRNFVISDAVFNKDLHVLLTSIEQDLTKVNWITFRQNNGKFEQIALRELQVKSYVQYLCLEASCEAIYVISDSHCKFTLDSEKEINSKAPTYKWTQNLEEITIKIPLSNAEKAGIHVETQAETLEITVNNDVILKGDLFRKIEWKLTNWVLENNCLEVNLTKQTKEIWHELVKNDSLGEYEVTPLDETGPPQGVTFNSQQIEECDFELDKFSIFERLTINHETSHKINLGSHQILCTTSTRGFGVRSDVDTCIFQPCFTSDFEIIHKGTLYAMGYIQASKQQRKFFVCSNDFSYSVICESNKHVFVYRQNVMVTNGELRNRMTGKRIGNIAQQFVINLDTNEEILGVYAAQDCLFLLGESFLMCLHF